ncbi:unnamed protein product [Schistocephalus solidus]|uniref:RBD domain-containing protein n=1 Tax=Schistocephalus solidus TaxID=70667 RepID=A0A183TQK3_SCHSO|nr:unnamed protein product [Schistocephalus solidus]
MHHKMDPSIYTLLVPQRKICPGSKDIWRIAPPSSNISSWISSFDPVHDPHRRLGESMAGQQIIVTMPNNAKTVIRVNLDHPIDEAIKAICSIKKLSPSELQAFAPNGNEPLDPCLSFTAQNITDLELKSALITIRSLSFRDSGPLSLLRSVSNPNSGTDISKHRAPPPPTPVNFEPINQQIKEPLQLLTATTEQPSVNSPTTAPSEVEPTCEQNDGSQTTDPPQQQPRHFERMILCLDEASTQPSPQSSTNSIALYEATTMKSSTEVSVKVPLDVTSSDCLEAKVTHHRQQIRQFARFPLHPEVDVCENDPQSQPTIHSPPELTVTTGEFS